MADTQGVEPYNTSILVRQARAAAIGTLATVCIAAVCGPQARASESAVAEMLNRLRSSQSVCAGAAGLAKLVRRPALDQAAAKMLGGEPFGGSLRAADYRAESVKGFKFYGSADSAVLGRLFAVDYCAAITDAELVEMGIHQRGTTTWVLLAKAFAPGGGLDEAATASLVLRLVNQARAQSRLCGDAQFAPTGRVHLSEVLAHAARAHSQDMARNDYFNHVSLDGATPAERIRRAGYVSLVTGENIAAGQMTAAQVVTAWIESPEHCSVLMDPEFTEMGVSLAVAAKSRHGTYWTQKFGTPRPNVRRKDRA